MMAARSTGADAAMRLAAVAEARRWIGTPYRHQASLKGCGADCLGLIRGVWRELCGAEPETPPPYSQDWCEVSRDEVLWRAASRLLVAARGDAAGDVLLFRMAEGAPAKHLAILGKVGAGTSIIHAYAGRAVIESPFIESWRRRVVAAFQFPEGD